MVQSLSYRVHGKAPGRSYMVSVVGRVHVFDVT
jgi:hypothetical protein